MRIRSAVIGLGLLAADFLFVTTARAGESFSVTGLQNRDGPQMTVEVHPQSAFSNWYYNIRITTTFGLDQHVKIRNGKPLKPDDMRLADVNADGFLDLMIVSGTDHRGEDWFKTWLYDPESDAYKWIAGAAGGETGDEEGKKRDVLWQALLKVLPKEYKEIDVYAENPSLNQVLFRSRGTTLTFSLETGKVEPVLHMKVLPAINRITFEQSKNGGWFVLWYYGQKELEISATE